MVTALCTSHNGRHSRQWIKRTMPVQLKQPAPNATPLRLVARTKLDEALRQAGATTRRWLQATGFRAAEHSHALLPGADGGLAEVWVGLGEATGAATDVHGLSALPQALPEGRYRLADATAGMASLHARPPHCPGCWAATASTATSRAAVHRPP